MATKEEEAAAAAARRKNFEEQLHGYLALSERTEKELEHAFDDLTDAAQAWVDGESDDEDLAKLDHALRAVRQKQEDHNSALINVRDAAKAVANG